MEQQVLDDTKSSPDDLLPEPWLSALGLRWNPFEHGESSADRHLGDYIVGHDAFAVAWTDMPALVYAPAGGGKTAMRLYATQLCWRALGPAHPLPVAYLPTSNVPIGMAPSLDEHARWLGDACARTMLLALAYRPERFLRLDGLARRELALTLQAVLRRDLPRDLRQLGHTGDLAAWHARLDRHFPRLERPSPDALQQFCAGLTSSIDQLGNHTWTPQDMLDSLFSLAREALRFRAVYVMVDGLDATESTVTQPDLAAQWLDALLEKASDWRRHGVVLKCFLPAEMAHSVDKRIAKKRLAHSAFTTARLEWSPALLAELIRSRVFVASEGRLQSLSALFDESLLDVDEALAGAARPLPRDVIRLTQRVLAQARRRLEGQVGLLNRADVEDALVWYRQDIARVKGVNVAWEAQ